MSPATTHPHLMDAVGRLLEAASPEALREVLLGCPDLLGEDGIALLRLMAARDGQGDEPAARALIDEKIRLLERCRQIGIDAAIVEKARADATPHLAPGLEAQVKSAAELEQRFHRTGDPAALATLFGLWQAVWDDPAFATAPSPFRVMTFQRGGDARVQRFLLLREREDLDRGIAIWERALRETPEGRPDRAAFDNNLGKAYLERWRLLAEPADLERAVQHLEASLRRTPPAHPHRAMHAGNLGVALRERAARSGSEGDLKRSIELLGEAVALSRRGMSDLPHWLHQAALGLNDRWRTTGELRDLARAANALTESCDLSPLSTPGLSDRLTALAGMLREGHARGGPSTMLADAAWAEEMAACLGRRPKGEEGDGAARKDPRP